MAILSDIDRHTPEESQHLRKGFPAELANEVDHVRRIMPVPPKAKSSPSGALRLAGEWIVPLHRQHYDPLERSYLDVFTARQRAIFDCLYSRHGNGHVRERSLRHLADMDEIWIRPYLTLSLTDYVIEVASIAADRLDYFLSDAGLDFAGDNPHFIELSLARAISCWNEHYRGRYRHKADYPPVAVLLQISQEIGQRSKSTG